MLHQTSTAVHLCLARRQGLSSPIQTRPPVLSETSVRPAPVPPGRVPCAASTWSATMTGSGVTHRSSRYRPVVFGPHHSGRTVTTHRPARSGLEDPCRPPQMLVYGDRACMEPLRACAGPLRGWPDAATAAICLSLLAEWPHTTRYAVSAQL